MPSGVVSRYTRPTASLIHTKLQQENIQHPYYYPRLLCGISRLFLSVKFLVHNHCPSIPSFSLEQFFARRTRHASQTQIRCLSLQSANIRLAHGIPPLNILFHTRAQTPLFLITQTAPRVWHTVLKTILVDLRDQVLCVDQVALLRNRTLQLVLDFGGRSAGARGGGA